LANIAFAFGSLPWMPERMAVHFATDGSVNRFDSSIVYAVIMSVVACFVAAIMFGVSFFTSFASTHMPESVNIPNRDYWMNEENRPKTIRRLSYPGELIGVGTLLLILLIQWELVRVNLTVPPGQPSISVLMCSTGVLLAVIVFENVRVFLSFRLPKSES
jgi:uncharacterized membrane protein